MIEINLLPGATRRKKRRVGGGLSLSLPSRDNLPEIDRWVLAIVGAWIAAPALAGWMYFGVTGRRSQLEADIDQAVQDSTRYARLIEAANTLRARQDTIAQKLQIIQQIDGHRYVWAHVMDELSRALPDYTWLTSVAQTSGGDAPFFQIEGMTGNYFALTRFMGDLEASPFIKGVRLTTTQQDTRDGKVVNQFVLDAQYEPPAPEFLETVPLFEGSPGAETTEEADGAASQ